MSTSRPVYPGAVFALVIAITVLSSCGSSSSNTGGAVSSASARIVACPAAGTAAVAISGSAFQPTSITVAVNSVVKWTNNDAITHTVTSGSPGAVDGKFDSGNLSPNGTVCVQFLSAGTYAYFCNIHTFMTGLVSVQ